METMQEKIRWTVVSLAAFAVMLFCSIFVVVEAKPPTCADVYIQPAIQTTEFTTAVEDQRVAIETAQAEQIAAIEAAEAAARAASRSSGSSYSNNSGDHLTKSGGVYYYNGRKETWYSQRVLPGGGLDIPGRHVNAEDGTVRDEDGYICVAASDLPKGTIVETSLGTGKVYDTGCAPGTTDIYVDW